MANFDAILNQSYQDDINRLNNRPINTSESKNIENLFKKLEGIDSECILCYNNRKCLQCYQCTEGKYCQECMTKVISEFHKCSTCQCNLINNYTKIENKNKQIINELNKKKIQNNNNQNNNQNNHQNNHQNNQNNYKNADYMDLDYADYVDSEMEQIEIAIFNSLNESNNNTNRNIANNANNINNANNKSKLEINIEELQNNQILPFKFSSLKNHLLIPNFECVNDTNNKLLIFCAHDKHLPNININYKIFDTTFQSEFRVLLVYLVNEKKIENKFNNIWIKIHNTIQEFYNNNIHHKKNELLSRIRNIISE
jgi:hypothetical protein